MGEAGKTNDKGDEIMPINREKSIQVGSSITNSVNDTLEDLADRIGITKSTYIRKAIKEMNCRLIEEIQKSKVLS